jgi:hypothetical protein
MMRKAGWLYLLIYPITTEFSRAGTLPDSALQSESIADQTENTENFSI